MDRSHRPDATGWSELERRFFEEAPPEVAVQPPPPPTFDDLMYDELPRRVPERRSRARLGPLTRLRAKETAAVASTQLARVARRARAIGIIAWRTCVAFAKLARRELGPFLRSVAAAAVPALQRVGRHVIDLLPSERPDGMTLLAGVAALVLMVSVSASLLSSHGPWLTFLR